MAEKKTSFQDALTAANKKWKTHAGSLNSVAEDVVAISTGNIAIDHITGVGGLPLGRSVELFGPQSSGKTTTALQCAAALQRIILAGGDESKGIGPDDVIIYFDYEHAMDPEYVKKLGLDVNHGSFVFAQPDTLEEGANLARDLIATGLVRMVIWDSVAAMNPSAKSEAETGKSLPAIQAKLMSEFMQAMNPLLHKHNCLSVFLNHIYEVMDMGGGRPGMPKRTSTPGGRALKFYSSMRIEYQPIGNVKTKVIDPISREEIESPTATNVKVTVVKNKVGPPFRKAIVRVRYGKGFDNFWTALQVLISYKEVMYSTGFYYFHKVEDKGLAPEWMQRAATGTQRPNIRGEATLFAVADKKPEWRDSLIAYATTVLNTSPEPEEEIQETSENDLQNQEISHIVELTKVDDERV